MNKKQERETIQKKLILNTIKSLKTHPSVEDLFNIIKKKIPNISIVTIYRNLDYLYKNNKIIKLNFKNKKTRYDGDTSKHHHLVCNNCGKIIDIFDNIQICKKNIKTKYKFEINTEHLEFYGLCEDCNKKNIPY